MKFYFLLALVPFLSCHSSSPVEKAEDSVLTSIAFNKDSTALIPGYSVNKARRKLRTTNIHGANFSFEIDSSAVGRYLLVFGKDKDTPEFRGVIASNRTYPTGDSTSIEKQINEVGVVEIRFDTLVYYEYSVTTKIGAGAKKTSATSAEISKFVFREDGTLLGLLKLTGEKDIAVFNEVKKKLAKQIAAMTNEK